MPRNIFIILMLILSSLTVPVFAVKNMALLEFKAAEIPVSEVNLIRGTLETVLVKATDIPIVDRKKMNKILKEHEIQLSGLTPSENAVTIGKILNVHYLMSGDLSKTGGKYYLTLKVVSVENARTLGAKQVSAKTIEELMKEIEKKIPDEFNGLATLETYYPSLDEKDTGIDVQAGTAGDHLRFSVSINQSSAGSGIHFDISKIDIAYFTKIVITFDKSLPGKIELGLSDSKEKDSEYITLNKLATIDRNTYEIKISDLKLKDESEWTTLSLIFKDRMKNVQFVIQRLVVIP